MRQLQIKWLAILTLFCLLSFASSAAQNSKPKKGKAKKEKKADITKKAPQISLAPKVETANPSPDVGDGNDQQNSTPKKDTEKK
jgi:hypothetical protein